MTKNELKMLERLYAAEIDGALNHHPGILQSKSKLLSKLEAEGFVRRVRRELKPDRFGPIVIEGWELTVAGNMAFCFSCAGEALSDGDLHAESAPAPAQADSSKNKQEPD